MVIHLRSVLRFLVVLSAILSGTRSARAIEPRMFFQPPVNLGPVVSSPLSESSPTVWSDGSSPIFSSDRLHGQAHRDLSQLTRATMADPWTTLGNSGPIVHLRFREFVSKRSIVLHHVSSI